ncbi:MAG: hypothetical protein H7X99_09550 [Saprospiraceae bacterium]|nr:hypothetical protein [Saprospiraceae bacterium]
MVCKLRIGCMWIFAVMVGCSHDSTIPDIIPISTYKTITPTCPTCITTLLCATVDDIVVNNSTIFSTTKPQPEGQGSWQMEGTSCATWTPDGNQTEIVTTALIACNDEVCDTTFITIFPPLPVDTETGIPCKVDVIYFEKDVLPILSASCAYSGCHNAVSRKDGIILDTYANVMNTGKVKPGNLKGSKLYEAITETDSDDIMPPKPAVKLSNAQIDIVAKWILQGAKNETCDFNSAPCNTDNISFNNFVRPALASCTSCHKTGNTSGGINLDTYNGVKSAAESGRLYGALSWASGFKPMPQGGSKFGDCNIKKIKSWIDAGAQNN